MTEPPKYYSVVDCIFAVAAVVACPLMLLALFGYFPHGPANVIFWIAVVVFAVNAPLVIYYYARKGKQ